MIYFWYIDDYLSCMSVPNDKKNYRKRECFLTSFFHTSVEDKICYFKTSIRSRTHKRCPYLARTGKLWVFLLSFLTLRYRERTLYSCSSFCLSWIQICLGIWLVRKEIQTICHITCFVELKAYILWFGARLIWILYGKATTSIIRCKMREEITDTLQNFICAAVKVWECHCWLFWEEI